MSDGNLTVDDLPDACTAIVRETIGFPTIIEVDYLDDGILDGGGDTYTVAARA